jgi:pimeloyl-ACP methyl ester carboxylesterase
MGVATAAGLEQTTIAAGGVSLNVALAGPEAGPLLILLHGFPEFWYGWREHIGPLAEAGFRVAVPDQRGYNLSAKPTGVDAYRLDRLVGDVLALADALGRERFQLAGHDWGAAVSWMVAERAPERLERLVIFDAPHPALWKRAMTEDPAQRAKSRYVQMLRIPALPEMLVKLGGYSGLAKAFQTCTRPDAFTPEIMARYQAAWRQPGALTGTINWYRALFRQDLPVPAPGSLKPPTLILWGDLDPFAEPGLAEASAALCAEARVVHYPDAGHWLPHDKPEAVRREMLGFLRL